MVPGVNEVSDAGTLSGDVETVQSEAGTSSESGRGTDDCLSIGPMALSGGILAMKRLPPPCFTATPT
jgi:hypothetical protein